MRPDYSFVIPILNERDTLEELHRRLSGVMAQLDGPAEVVLVDDGSTDGSYDVMRCLHERDPREGRGDCRGNFGHQSALTAGLDHAHGNAVIIMDGDLQDPPEVALQLAQQWRQGHDVVYAVRNDRGGRVAVKLLTAKWFYRILNHISEVDLPNDPGDFRLIDRTRRRRATRDARAPSVPSRDGGVGRVRANRRSVFARSALSRRDEVSDAQDAVVRGSTASFRSPRPRSGSHSSSGSSCRSCRSCSASAPYS